jgi:hypothetical protein
MTIYTAPADLAQATRIRAVEDAIHSGVMEGLEVDFETRADADEYVAGRITSGGLVARTRARYGLD